MSAIYNAEPPTSGAVTLHTTHGPLDIRLWGADAALAARNFVQHCLDRTYHNLPFHRIVPSLLVQTGDPTGAGDGGRAALAPHAHLVAPRNARLRFRRRGLVAFVADNHSRAFRSQFFITLAPADWLDEEGHPIFGHVFGDTIYNLLNLAAHGPVDDPAAPSVPRVTGVTVVVSPFPELVPRPREKPVSLPPTEPAVPKRRATRSDRLLSFRNDDADSDDDDDDDAHGGNKVTNRVQRNARSSAAAPPRRMRPAGGMRHERPPPPRAVPDTGAKHDTARAAPGGAPEKRAAVVQDANDEFERLKAEMLGTAVAAGAAAEGADAGAADTGQAAADATAADDSSDARGSADGAGQSARRRRRVDESAILSRLKVFEGRIMSARRKGDTPARGAAWYGSALRLPKGIDDSTEYEVVDGPPPSARGPGRVVNRKARR